MTDASIRIEGLEALQRKLGNVPEGVKAGIKAGAQHIEGKIKRYPPSTLANDPRSRQWYERGYGPKWRVKSGEIHSRKSSEMLGRRWTIETRNQGLTAVVGNNVTYGPYVHDPERQVWFHKARGWKTTKTVAEEEADTVVGMIKAQIDKALEGK